MQYKSGEIMGYLVLIIIAIVLGVIIYSVIEEKIKYKDEEPEELTEQEKTMKAARILIYLIIGIIIASLTWKFVIIGLIIGKQ